MYFITKDKQLIGDTVTGEMMYVDDPKSYTTPKVKIINNIICYSSCGWEECCPYKPLGEIEELTLEEYNKYYDDKT